MDGINTGVGSIISSILCIIGSIGWSISERSYERHNRRTEGRI
jgi:hypothetical protein